MSQQTPSMKRGAQPGNTNAVKHGFYSNALGKSSHVTLSAARELSVDDLTEEIVQHRERLYTLLAAAPENFALWCDCLRTLTRMVATQYAMRPGTVERLNAASDNVIEDMRQLLTQQALLSEGRDA